MSAWSGDKSGTRGWCSGCWGWCSGGVVFYSSSPAMLLVLVGCHRGSGGRKGKMLIALACCAGSTWSCWWKNGETPSVPPSRYVSDVGASEEWGSRLRDETLGIYKTRMLVLQAFLLYMNVCCVVRVLPCLHFLRLPFLSWCLWQALGSLEQEADRTMF